MTGTRFPRHGLSMSNGSNSDGGTEVWFDHIEVHVHEVIACGDFLQRLLRGLPPAGTRHGTMASLAAE